MVCTGGGVMAVLALADVLEDFGCRRTVAPEVLSFAFSDPADAPDAPEIASAQQATGPDMDELIRIEVEGAERALSERLAAEHEAALADERRRHADEIEAIERRFGDLLGTKLAHEMAAMQSAVTTLVTGITARILGPVLTADMHARSIAQLAETVTAALEDAEGTRVRISGSPVLFDALQRAAGDKAAHFDFTESSSPDLTVRVDDRLFETRFSEWSATMEETLS
jgi:hypothetical protein